MIRQRGRGEKERAGLDLELPAEPFELASTGPGADGQNAPRHDEEVVAATRAAVEQLHQAMAREGRFLHGGAGRTREEIHGSRRRAVAADLAQLADLTVIVAALVIGFWVSLQVLMYLFP